MTTELTTTGSTALAGHAPAGTPALQSDILIPQVLLMQGLSDFVAERIAVMGDIVRSTTAEKLGDDKNPIEFIPLALTNDWMESERVGEKYEFRSRYARTAKNELLNWEFTKNGGAWKRTKVINCFALLTKDIDAYVQEIETFQKTGEIPDLNKTLLPVVISFRSKSFKAGRAVATHFTKAASMAAFGAKAHGFSLILGCYPDKNNKGNYFVFDIRPGKKISGISYTEAEKWVALISAKMGEVQIDDSAERTAPVGEEDVAY